MSATLCRGRAPRGAAFALAAALLLTAPAARAEAGAGPDSGRAPPAETDVRDILRTIRHGPPPAPDSSGGASYRRRMVFVTPVVNYNPVTSVIFGLGVLTSTFHGDPNSTFPSTVQAGGSVSLEKQISISAKADVYTDRDRWFFQANPAWAKYPQSIYALGTDSPDSSQVGVYLYIPKFSLSAYRQVLPKLFTGVGLQCVMRTDIRPSGGFAAIWDRSPFVAYSREHRLDLERQTSAGVSLNLLFDGRDNPTNASRGWFANASGRAFFKDFLGGSSHWQELYLDLRHYRSLDRDARHRVAAWAYSDFVVGGVAPFFDLPATGAVPRGRAGRGYDGNRFRGERMAYAELEYRVTLTRNGLLGAVAFLNTESFGGSQTGSDLFDSFATAGGAGLRILVDKRAKSNVCFDVGIGKSDSHGLWAGFQESF